ncbi:MAG: response regulator [Ktedonobacterales bacterium]|nr:response regulator [Ktedonobacterales bacterium]
MAKRILTVDDNDDILNVVGFALEDAGFEVRAAHNQHEMEAALAQGLPDLMVLDLMLPGANGYQVLQKLHDNDQTRDIPVIVMTAKAEALYRHMSADLGVAHHFTKPFPTEALVTEAQTILHER